MVGRGAMSNSIEELAGSKFLLVTGSNTTEAHIKSLHSQFVFLNSFNGIITSERAGTHKPNPNIFNFALQEANTNAVSTVFIDDSYSNVGAAENMGFMVHHYVNFETFQRFIQAYI